MMESLRRGYARGGGRIGGPGATMAGHWPALIVSVIVVFACFFALGRAGRGGEAVHAEVPSTLLAATSVRAEIPVGLAGGPLLEGAIPLAARVRPKVAPRRTAPAPSSGTNLNASVPAQSLAAEAPQEPTPAPAPTVPSSATSPPPATSPTRSSSHPSSGGGSFDTSE
jgi:hypothetical protein